MKNLVRRMWPKLKLALTIQLVGASLSVLCAFCSGCATGYLADRGRDAADIFTASAGLGLGAQARIGPLHAGLGVFHDVAGLRGGRVVTYPSGIHGEHGALESISEETTIQSYEYFDPNASVADEVDRFKRFEAHGFPFVAFVSTEENHLMSKEEQAMVPLLHSYYTQIEVTGSILGGVRLGFNPGEFLDFILGWFGIDIYNDDVRNRKEEI
jgi:hypothetical protein